jgi:plastocyanin
MAKASLVALTVALAVAGCGGSTSTTSSAPDTQAAAPPATSSSSGSGGGHRLQVGADPGGALRFTKSSLTAKAGKVSIDFSNTSSIGHNLTIQRGSTGPNVGATPTFTGGSKVLKLDLKPGTYTFYCSVPGHRQGGMHGTLVVK